MKEKSFKVLFVAIMIVILLMTDFVILGQGIAIAIYEELERAERFIRISVMFNNQDKTSSEKRWTVDFVYHDVQYLLKATELEQPEIEKIINSLSFFE